MCHPVGRANYEFSLDLSNQSLFDPALRLRSDIDPSTARKGLCTTHLRDVSDYFRGAHVTINAREDDEVEEAEFVAKVAKASSSSYNFKERPAAVDEAPQPPVGSGHKRIIPEMEIPKSRERENFWSQEQGRRHFQGFQLHTIQSSALVVPDI